MNFSLDALRSGCDSRDTLVYSYVIATVDRVDDAFVQYGSGPNWQGGKVTLCTCKHSMRAFHEPAEWKGVWIAGFCGLAAGQGRNALVYLMKVGQAYESHSELWHALPSPVRRARRRPGHGRTTKGE